MSKRRRLYVRNTEAIICFILFFRQFSDRSYGSYMIRRPILIKFNSKFRTKMLFTSVGGYMLKTPKKSFFYIFFRLFNRSYNLFHIIFLQIFRSFLWYSRPISIKLNSKFRHVISKRRSLYVKKHEAIICFIVFPFQFSDRSYGSYMI